MFELSSCELHSEVLNFKNSLPFETEDELRRPWDPLLISVVDWNRVEFISIWGLIGFAFGSIFCKMDLDMKTTSHFPFVQ